MISEIHECAGNFLEIAEWRLSDVVTAETLPGPERLSSAYSAYKKHAEALGEWSPSTCDAQSTLAYDDRAIYRVAYLKRSRA